MDSNVHRFAPDSYVGTSPGSNGHDVPGEDRPGYWTRNLPGYSKLFLFSGSLPEQVVVPAGQGGASKKIESKEWAANLRMASHLHYSTMKATMTKFVARPMR